MSHKPLQKYRVKRAYGTYKKGDIITPTGMLRDELRANGWIEKVVEEAPKPVKAAPEAAVKPAQETAAKAPSLRPHSSPPTAPAGGSAHSPAAPRTVGRGK